MQPFVESLCYDALAAINFSFMTQSDERLKHFLSGSRQVEAARCRAF
jgi:hypothetical protein